MSGRRQRDRKAPPHLAVYDSDSLPSEVVDTGRTPSPGASPVLPPREVARAAARKRGRPRKSAAAAQPAKLTAAGDEGEGTDKEQDDDLCQDR